MANANPFPKLFTSLSKLPFLLCLDAESVLGKPKYARAAFSNAIRATDLKVHWRAWADGRERNSVVGNRRNRNTARRAPRPVLKPSRPAIRVEDFVSAVEPELLAVEASRGCLSMVPLGIGVEAEEAFVLRIERTAESMDVTAAEPIAKSKRACPVISIE